MRVHLVPVVAVAITLAACGEAPNGVSTGTLVVSTRTTGDDPDPDGYLLTIDGAISLGLHSNGIAEVDVDPGRHAVQLVGVSDHCSVAPGAELEVDVPSRGTIPIAFDISCPATGVRITVTTMGADLDPGYHIVVDGNDQRDILPSATTLILIDPGNRTVSLTDIATNCSVDGPASRIVTVVEKEVVPIEFAVVCTATTGVIGVVISGSGIGTTFEAVVDATTSFGVGGNGRGYLEGVPAGDHVVTVTERDGCSVETGPQSVTITTGTPVRDTVEVVFSVACSARVQVSVQTVGLVPSGQYSVWLCGIDEYYCVYGRRSLLGHVGPNGTLTANVETGSHRIYLTDLHRGCQVPAHDRNPTAVFNVSLGMLHTVVFHVVCSS